MSPVRNETILPDSQSFYMAHFCIRYTTGLKIVISGSTKYKYSFISVLMLTSRVSVRIYLVGYQNNNAFRTKAPKFCNISFSFQIE